MDERFFTSRGYLPHYDRPGACQVITYHLADSLPQTILRAMEAKKERHIEEGWSQPKLDCFERKAYDYFLDQHYGSCLLRRPECAKIVIENWKHFDGERYKLIAWVVMPNHIHICIRLNEDISLKKIIHSWKSYTAKMLLPYARPYNFPKGQFWHKGYRDRFVRDANHFHTAIHYINENPVKAGLVKESSDWPFGSAGEQQVE